MSVSIVWLNETRARVYHFSDDRMEREVLYLEPGWPETHDTLAGHLLNSKQILVLSPSTAGSEFVRHMSVRFPEIHRRVVGCEILNEADDAAVAEYAIKYFRRPVGQAN